MELIIRPYDGVGGIKLGMSLKQVHDLLGEPNISGGTREAYMNFGLLIDYIKPGVCEFVEMVPPASPKFQGQTFLGKPFSIMTSWFRKRDQNIEVEYGLLISRKFGIALYTSLDEDDPVESVAIFERDYYDDPKRTKLRIDLDKYKSVKMKHGKR